MSCTDYHMTKLMCHTQIMKLWEKVMEQRLRKQDKLFQKQFVFMLGTSTMEAFSFLDN